MLATRTKLRPYWTPRTLALCVSLSMLASLFTLYGPPSNPKLDTTQLADDIRTRFLTTEVKHEKLPLAVHKVWGLMGASPELTGKYKEMNEKEFALNPLLAHIVWDFAKSVELLNQFGDKKIIEMFSNYPEAVMKGDLVRNVILFMEGGIYQDMDVLPLKPWHEIIALADAHLGSAVGVILFLDSPPNLSVDRLCPKEKQDGWLTRVAFDTFIAARHHPFILDIINVQKERFDAMQEFLHKGGQWYKYCDVCYYSGPDTITTAYNRYKHKYNDIYVFSYADTQKYVNFGKAHGWIQK